MAYGLRISNQSQILQIDDSNPVWGFRTKVTQTLSSPNLSMSVPGSMWAAFAFYSSTSSGFTIYSIVYNNNDTWTITFRFGRGSTYGIGGVVGGTATFTCYVFDYVSSFNIPFYVGYGLRIFDGDGHPIWDANYSPIKIKNRSSGPIPADNGTLIFSNTSGCAIIFCKLGGAWILRQVSSSMFMEGFCSTGVYFSGTSIYSTWCAHNEVPAPSGVNSWPVGQYVSTYDYILVDVSMY